ncbi:MAG: hypothetical protein ACYCX7_05595, partial [Solirubrobacteraceae bacterium]
SGAPARGPAAPEGPLRLETDIVFVVDRFIYEPVSGVVLRIAARVRGSQSGRLSAYLLYMLLALILALSLVPILS